MNEKSLQPHVLYSSSNFTSIFLQNGDVKWLVPFLRVRHNAKAEMISSRLYLFNIKSCYMYPSTIFCLKINYSWTLLCRQPLDHRVSLWWTCYSYNKLLKTWKCLLSPSHNLIKTCVHDVFTESSLTTDTHLIRHHHMLCWCLYWPGSTVEHFKTHLTHQFLLMLGHNLSSLPQVSHLGWVQDQLVSTTYQQQ